MKLFDEVIYRILSLTYSSIIFRLDIFANEYGASRINLDDCLSPAQFQWILIAVLIPVGSMGFVIASYLLVKAWDKKVRKRRALKRRQKEQERRSTQTSTLKGKRNMFMTRTTTQFEIMED